MFVFPFFTPSPSRDTQHCLSTPNFPVIIMSPWRTMYVARIFPCNQMANSWALQRVIILCEWQSVLSKYIWLQYFSKVLHKPCRLHSVIVYFTWGGKSWCINMDFWKREVNGHLSTTYCIRYVYECLWYHLVYCRQLHAMIGVPFYTHPYPPEGRDGCEKVMPMM